MSAKRLLAASLALALGGCGFRPLYANDDAPGSTGRALSTVYVEPISDLSVANTGYDLRNSMIQFLDGNRDTAAYRLQLTLNITTEGIALEDNASITRYNDTLTVTYALTDASGSVVTKGVETGLGAYNVVSSPYATLAAQQDADRRAAADLADRIRIRLAAYFDEHSGAVR